MDKNNWSTALADDVINIPLVYLLEQNIEQTLIFHGCGVMYLFQETFKISIAVYIFICHAERLRLSLSIQA
jgi:hypothetical protein